MRLARPALALALAGSLAGAGYASAAVKAVPPVCNIVTDDEADASLTGVDPSDGSLDIVSADIASDDKTFTAAIRLKNAAATSPTAVSGRNYYLQVEIPGAEFPVYVSYEEDATGESFNWGTLEPGTGGVSTYSRKGEATGAVTGNEIHIHVPVSDIGSVGSVKKGVKISTVETSTTAVVGLLVFDVDTASGTKPYTTGAKSCVTPGK